MRILLDTNILARLAQPRHELHSLTVSAMEMLLQGDNEIRLVPQVIYEFWAIATRSVTDNGLGLSVEQVETEINQFKLVFPPLRDERGVLEPWQQLVTAHRVHGKAAHDARIVAAMKRHGLTHLLTFNLDDFKRYPGLELLDPNEVGATKP
jgi:predicted nucleic acid-binding protein